MLQTSPSPTSDGWRARSTVNASIASFALQAVTAWTLHRARPAPEAVDPSTGLGASQLAAIKGYLARAAERDVEPDEPVEDIAVPSFRMPLLATAWGARAIRVRRRASRSGRL
jgi:hypothetical protein